MLRRFALVATLLVAATLPTEQPAAAHVDVCAGEWTVYVSPSFEGLLGRPILGSFSGAQTVGACALSFFGGMSGGIAGHAGFATGLGAASVYEFATGTYESLSFDFLWIGTTIQFVGELHGTLNIVAWTPYQCYLHGTLEVLHDL